MRLLPFAFLMTVTSAFADMTTEIRKQAHLFGLEPALALAIAQVESGFNPRALRFEPKFKTYSVGLFQIFYPTAKSMGFKGSVQGLLHPKTNTRLGLMHIRQCSIDFGAKPEEIACCYNAGVAVKRSTCRNSPKLRAYISKVMAARKIWE